MVLSEIINPEDLKEKMYPKTMFINHQTLTSLKGCPTIINGDFLCYGNKLKSLENRPQEVFGNFNVEYNKLTTLEGRPQNVEKDFICSDNNLKSLKGSPIIINGDFYCKNNKLETLENSPVNIKGNFDCTKNKLKNLKGNLKRVSLNFYCNDNELETLEGRPKIIGELFNCLNNPKLKNIKKQIIENGIKAKYYLTDEGEFSFAYIEEEFLNYQTKKELFELKQQQSKTMIKKNKTFLNKIDYGLGI